MVPEWWRGGGPSAAGAGRDAAATFLAGDSRPRAVDHRRELFTRKQHVEDVRYLDFTTFDAALF